MKKVGDLLTALSAVAFIAVVLEFIIGWKMIPQSLIMWFIVGGIVLVIFGMIMRNSGAEKPDGSDMKHYQVSR